MSAAALRHPETESEAFEPEAFDSATATVANASIANATTDVADTTATDTEFRPSDARSAARSTSADADWHQYKRQVSTFTGHAHETEREKRRRKATRHRSFRMSASFCAGTLVLVELVALVWMYAVDLKTMRQSEQLDRDIKETNLRIALAKDQLASYNATPQLNQWAQDLHYRQAQPYEMDDVTSNAPIPQVKEDKTSR